jgi:membrane fusion protein (multidrug efflux system)
VSTPGEQDTPSAPRADARPDTPSVPERAPRRARNTLIAWSVVGGLTITAVVLGLLVASKREAIDARRRSERAGRKPAVDVVVREVELQDVVDQLRLPAKAAAWSDVWVSAEAAGTLKSVEVVELQDVREGDILCRIDDREHKAAVEAGRAALEGVRAAQTLAQIQLRRISELRKTDAVGQSEFDAAEAALRQATAAVNQAKAGLDRIVIALDRTVVRAPVDGTVSSVPIEVGQLVSPGQKIARILELDRIRVTVGIPEIHAAKARSVDTVELTLKALPGSTFVGTRVYLGVEPQEKSFVYPMELAVENEGRRILPGMFVTARVVLEVRRRPVIPLFSIIPREDDKVAFVVEDGVARRRAIEIGLIMGSSLPEASVEIIKGIEAGEMLIVQGQRRVEDGDGVTVHAAAQK